MWTFVLLFGASNGMTTLVRASLVAELFGSANYGEVSGALALIVSLTQAAAPLAVGVLHEWSGGYGVAVWLLPDYPL